MLSASAASRHPSDYEGLGKVGTGDEVPRLAHHITPRVLARPLAESFFPC